MKMTVSFDWNWNWAPKHRSLHTQVKQIYQNKDAGQWAGQAPEKSRRY